MAKFWCIASQARLKALGFQCFLCHSRFPNRVSQNAPANSCLPMPPYEHMRANAHSPIRIFLSGLPTVCCPILMQDKAFEPRWIQSSSTRRGKWTRTQKEKVKRGN
jgi:hypothetical protein